MGLSLVKRLVELHHGSVSFRSEGPGLGSEVTFSIPLVSNSAASNATVDVQLPSRRILVVDDNPDSADALGQLLEDMGQQVRVAYSGESGIEIAREQRPQVAFIDLMMPRIDGSETATRLRREFTSAELVLVGLSGYSRSVAAARADSFDHYLIKPASREEIAEFLNGL